MLLAWRRKKQPEDLSEQRSENSGQGQTEPNQKPPQEQAGLRGWYFLAVNAIYRYCYFVGLQLLRSTRGHRRHMVRLLSQLAEGAGRRLRRRKRAFKEALRELGTVFYLQFRRYGTTIGCLPRSCRTPKRLIPGIRPRK